MHYGQIQLSVRTDHEKGSLEESITSPAAEQQLKIIFRLFIAIGLLQLAITWYKIRHPGGQAHYYSRTGTLAVPIKCQ